MTLTNADRDIKIKTANSKLKLKKKLNCSSVLLNLIRREPAKEWIKSKN